MLHRQYLVVELADETTHKLTVGNPSFVAYERTATKRKWPTDPSESPITWQTFIAWHQLKAQKLYEGSFEDFSDRDCMAVVATDKTFTVELGEEDEPEPVDPTRPEDE